MTERKVKTDRGEGRDAKLLHGCPGSPSGRASMAKGSSMVAATPGIIPVERLAPARERRDSSLSSTLAE
jgi:hypothetical protein